MSKSEYKYTPGQPRSTGAIIFIALMALFFMYGLLPGYDSTMAWGFSLFVFGPLFIVFIIIGIGTAIKFSARISYLRRQKIRVPVAHYVVVPLAILLAISPVWTYMLADSRVSTEMNTIEEFTKSANSCTLESVDSYYNGSYHRANDADAYIVVYPNALYYPIYELDKLKEIYDKASREKCPSYLEHREYPIWDADGIQYEQW